MMRRMASEAVDNYFADPGKMVTTATVLQCRPVGRSENPLGTISNQKKKLEAQDFPSIPVQIRRGRGKLPSLHKSSDGSAVSRKINKTAILD